MNQRLEKKDEKKTMMMMTTTTSTKTKLAIERKTDKALLKYGRMAENRQSENVAYFMRMRCMVDRKTVASFFSSQAFTLFLIPFSIRNIGSCSFQYE